MDELAVQVFDLIRDRWPMDPMVARKLYMAAIWDGVEFLDPVFIDCEVSAATRLDAINKARKENKDGYVFTWISHHVSNSYGVVLTCAPPLYGFRVEGMGYWRRAAPVMVSLDAVLEAIDRVARTPMIIGPETSTQIVGIELVERITAAVRELAEGKA